MRLTAMKAGFLLWQVKGCIKNNLDVYLFTLKKESNLLLNIRKVNPWDILQVKMPIKS